MEDGTQSGAAQVKALKGPQGLAERPADAPLSAPPEQQVAGISAPVGQTGVNHLAMNAVIPGLGSLLRGHKGLGAAQLALGGVGLLLLISLHLMLAIFVLLGAYGWSIASGVGYLSGKDRKLEWH